MDEPPEDDWPHPLAPWLLLSHLPGMHPALFHALSAACGPPAEVLRTDPAELARAGVPEPVWRGLEAYQQRPAGSEPARGLAADLDWLAAPRRHILSLDCPAYPSLLKAIFDPPPVLYVLGDVDVLACPQIALVGSRRPTAGGRRAARRLAAQLARRGLAVCSGMALGIDRESHEGALDAAGPTVAVLGTGIDIIYPAAHNQLAQRIVDRGALVSEFPLGTPPRPWHFPRRNRIISGMSLGTVVVEAAARSGSLITARCALEQGREVFAVPGSIDNSRSRGCHELIKDGARLVQEVDDILEEVGWQAPSPGATAAGVGDGNPTEPEAGEEAAGRVAAATPRDTAARVAREIGYDAMTVDALQSVTGLPVPALSAALVELELAGAIESGPEGYTLRRT